MTSKTMLSPQKSKYYFPNLDASRFWAFIPVYLTHCFYSSNSTIINSNFYVFVQHHLKLGLLGLDYFFVLSGFLITWIIIEEQKQTKNFSLKNFYVRRGLRIFPLYFLMVCIGFFIQFISKIYFDSFINTLPNFFYFLSFTLNFYIIENGKEFLFFLVFFWSVSVEEQFYIFWSLCLKYLSNYLKGFALTMILVSISFRIYFLDNDNQLVFNTLSSIANFGCGALLAFYCFHFPSIRESVSNITKKTILLVYVLFAICFIFYNQIFCYTLTVVLERFIFSIFFCFIIAEQVYCKNSFFKLGNNKFFDFFGKLSFGLYCYHGLIITLYIKIMGNSYLLSNKLWVLFVAPTIIFIATLLASLASFNLFEKKILKLKKRFN
jgi:peptidoglycan/LPS O-acetylase OafA/YrhL